MASGAWSKPPATASVDLLRLSPSHIHTTLASVRTCVSIDFWPPNKQCRAGSCPWEKASVLAAYLDDPLLVAAVGALLPLTIRVGGSLADQITYTNIPGHATERCDDLVSFPEPHAPRQPVSHRRGQHAGQQSPNHTEYAFTAKALGSARTSVAGLLRATLTRFGSNARTTRSAAPFG